MSERVVHWRAGEAVLQSQIENAIADHFRTATLLHESARRTVHRVLLANAGNSTKPVQSVVVKVHHTATGRHPLRENLKWVFGRSPARREWKALQALFEGGVPVPRPRAWGRLANRDEIVVTDFVDGERIPHPTLARNEVVKAMASAIARLHDAGYRHGDLHLGNLMVVNDEIVLLDLQHARPRRSERERLFDLARLELSAAKAGWNPRARRALRERLGVGDESGRALRLFLRDHLRGRARRVLRVGRNWSTARVGKLRGLRDTSFEAETLSALIESSKLESSVRQRRGGRVQIIETRLTDSGDGEHIVLIKRIAAGNLRRALGDRLRGTPAARAFRAGQASGLLSTRAARPLAFLEERRYGLPIHSWLILEKAGEQDLDRALPRPPETEREFASALGEWLADGHAWGLSHRDLKASNIRVTIRSDFVQFWMIDLEDLCGPAELSDDARIHALSQLNASLGDDAMSLEMRLVALEAYEDRAPFSPHHESAAMRIARHSLARAHRWHGCDATDGSSIGPERGRQQRMDAD